MQSRYIIIGFLCTVVTLGASAQGDSTKPNTINITSAYKPVLRNAVKINFSAAPMPADTIRKVLTYNIPAQNLFYAYQPVPMQPLALQQDSVIELGNRRFVKAGFGNYITPYIQGGVVIGDGKKSLVQLKGEYISSNNTKIEHQRYAQLKMEGNGSYFFPANEFYGGLAFNARKYNLYGYDHTLYKYNKEDVRQDITDITLRAGYKNIKATEYGLNYNPHIELNFYSLLNRANESNFKFTLPVEKQFVSQISGAIQLDGDITHFQSDKASVNKVSVSNNIFQLKPAVVFTDGDVKLSAGLVAAWNNGAFVTMPDLKAEAKFAEKAFTVLAGMTGRFLKNNFRNLSLINPYLVNYTTQKNTKETEIYGGLKMTLAKRFSLSAKAGLVNYTDLPLFINDTSGTGNEKSFTIVNESKARNFRISGDIGYAVPQKLSLNAALNINGYASLKDNEKPWHIIPMEVKASARFWPIKKLMLKADLYTFAASNYILKNNVTGKTGGGSDLSMGLEYRINNQFSAWIDGNNLTNNRYQRWYNYPVYGTNVIGGVIVRF